MEMLRGLPTARSTTGRAIGLGAARTELRPAFNLWIFPRQARDPNRVENTTQVWSTDLDRELRT
jgi:hypothetical protein